MPQHGSKQNATRWIIEPDALFGKPVIEAQVERTADAEDSLLQFPVGVLPTNCFRICEGVDEVDSLDIEGHVLTRFSDKEISIREILEKLQVE